MKLASYRWQGRESFGIVTDKGVTDLASLTGEATLRDAIGNGRLKKEPGDMPAALDLGQVDLLPAIPQPGKIICFGLNYRDHAKEAGVPIPEQPQIFSRFTDTLVAHGKPMIRPRNSTSFDFEGELAIVIGATARHVQPQDALSHVFGYTCFNDGSLRDFQKQSLTAGKNFPSTGALGPWVVTADEVGDPADLMLSTTVNGERVQHKSTGNMIFSVPQMIAYASSWTMLSPGDIICTGTPEGVGFARKPPLWLKPGDTVEVTISKIGTLSNTVAEE